VRGPRGDAAGATLDPQLDRSRMGVGSGDLHVLLGRPDEHVVNDVEQELQPLLRCLEHMFEATPGLGRNVCSERNLASHPEASQIPGLSTPRA
jgi:hypothetical protein